MTETENEFIYSDNYENSYQEMIEIKIIITINFIKHLNDFCILYFCNKFFQVRK